MMPHQVTLPNEKLSGAPALFAKAKKLAVGGHHSVYFLDLDEEGRAQPTAAKLQVLNPAVRVLLYSEKHDRLYVAVEVSK